MLLWLEMLSLRYILCMSVDIFCANVYISSFDILTYMVLRCFSFRKILLCWENCDGSV